MHWSVKQSLYLPHILYGHQQARKFIEPVDPELDLSKVSGWMILFHPNLLTHYPLGKKILDYGFFSYGLSEALHLIEWAK